LATRLFWLNHPVTLDYGLSFTEACLKAGKTADALPAVSARWAAHVRSAEVSDDDKAYSRWRVPLRDTWPGSPWLSH
jgi:hypothetical protein